MKKALISIAVIVGSALIMLLIQLQFKGWQLANVDVQDLVFASLTLDVTIYLALKYTPKNKDKKN